MSGNNCHEETQSRSGILCLDVGGLMFQMGWPMKAFSVKAHWRHNLNAV